jgi:amino acid transporter
MRELAENIISKPSVISRREGGTVELVRGLGLWAATAVVVSNIIGTAIFIVGSEVARDAGGAGTAIAAWVVGGFLSFCGALCLAELGAAMPRSGGMYEYLTRGLAMCGDSYTDGRVPPL